MTITRRPGRALGTMVAYGFATGGLAADLAIARRLHASVVEAFPDWRTLPEPAVFRDEVAAAGLAVHSAHGCWGGQSIRAARVDLGDPDVRFGLMLQLRVLPPA